MSELGPEARRILGAGRAGLEPSGEDRARSRSALARRLGAGAFVAATTAAAPTVGAATATLGVSLTTKLVIVASVLGVLGGGVVVARRTTPPVANSVASVSAPRVVTPAMSATTSAAVVVPSTSPPAASSVTAKATNAVAPPVLPASASVSASASIDEELALLRDAQAALSAGNAALAKKLLDRHAATFPTGSFAEERKALQIVARCTSGDPGAHTAATAYLTARPDAPMAARIRAACGLE
ncbi:MAG: hypothetical protein JNL79_06170 [Myxococcales bacterium]|nr:hypothetical protein [Myxococcales bacterium]